MNSPGFCRSTVCSVPSAYPVKLSRLSKCSSDGMAWNRRGLGPSRSALLLSVVHRIFLSPKDPDCQQPPSVLDQRCNTPTGANASSMYRDSTSESEE